MNSSTDMMTIIAILIVITLLSLPIVHLSH